MTHNASSLSRTTPTGTQATTTSDTAAGMATHAAIPVPTGVQRLGSVARWTLVTLAAAWIGLCTAVGPIYRADGSITQWSWAQTVLFIGVTALVLGIVIVVTRVVTATHTISFANTTSTITADQQPSAIGIALSEPADTSSTIKLRQRGLVNWQRLRQYCHISPWLQRFFRFATRVTSNPRTLWRVVLLSWLWAWVCFAVVMGADIFSQINEFTAFWHHAHGQTLPYSKSSLSYQADNQGILQFATIMDVYPTAHYLWPDQPTFLTNHHNIVLTLFYGAIAYVSQHYTGSVALGLILLAAAQYVLCAWIVARTVVRFVEPGWFITPRLPQQLQTQPLTQTLSSTTASTMASTSPSITTSALPSVTPVTRALVLIAILNPAFAVSSLGLTKSPLFAAALIWWFGCCYQFTCTHRAYTMHSLQLKARALGWRFLVEWGLATSLMLISAKYAAPLIAIASITMFLAFAHSRSIPLYTMLLPLLVFQCALGGAIHAGLIINGDPIEGKSMQLQQISRTAQRNRAAFTPELIRKLDPIIDINQAALAYYPQDADRVKSSGGEIHKRVVYQWETVTKEDMAQFNAAWLELGKRAPIEYIDAFLANSYGYFDIADVPYVSAFYYADNAQFARVPVLQHWLGGIRHPIAAFLQGWSRIPVLGWPLHGNFWTVIALIAGSCMVILRRWKLLSWHIVVVLLMGVMILAPANNFDRHMLPLFIIAPLMLVALSSLRTLSSIARSAHKQQHIQKQ